MTKTTRQMIVAAAMSGLVSGAVLNSGCESYKAGTESKSMSKAHACAGQNACKGLGGCKTGDRGCKGLNTCKGKGGCHVS